MPIKVRCQECSTVMGAPDKAAGRAVKCKKCGARVVVPGGSGGQAPRKKKKKRRAPSPEPSFDDFGADDPFGGMNLRSVEDSRQIVCPKCTKTVNEEDIECPHCGVNIETGALSEQQKKKKARKGPPPEEFYGTVWPNAWEFLKTHKSYALRTGLFWGLSMAMVIVAAYVMAWIIPAREQELIETAEGPVEFTANYVLIAPTDDADIVYDGVKYGPGSTRLNADKTLKLLPPRLAAIILATRVLLVIYISHLFCRLHGMGLDIVRPDRGTDDGQQEEDQNDSRATSTKNMMKGFLTIFWPSILMVPVAWIPNAMLAGGADPQISGILSIIIYLIPFVIFLPIAVVHFAQPYSYRAWLINWMGKDLLNTFAPTLYVSAMFFGLVLLLPLGLCIGMAVGWGHVAEFYASSIQGPALSSLFSDMESGWTYAFGRIPLIFMVAFTCCTIVGLIVAFPAVFMMRVFGLFGLYFRPDLALCVEQPPLSNAGFGPRYLAFQIDTIIVSLIIAVGVVVAWLVAKLWGPWGFIVTITTEVISGIIFYFANWESGSGRATLGKWSLGLIVVREDNEPMPRKQAVQRTLAAALNLFTLYIPFLMCAFHKQHRAGHDLMSKTKVVWRGDEDM